jgi:hypothetical protein
VHSPRGYNKKHRQRAGVFKKIIYFTLISLRPKQSFSAEKVAWARLGAYAPPARRSERLFHFDAHLLASTGNYLHCGLYSVCIEVCHLLLGDLLDLSLGDGSNLLSIWLS